MEEQAEQLRRKLRQYRTLLRNVSDNRAVDALSELIAETEAELREFEPARTP